MFLFLSFRNNWWRKLINKTLDTIACCWIYCNNAGLKITRTINWDVTGVENLSKKSWYIVIANHQSWTDIVVLQKILTGKIPFLKFFLKKELIWVPILGLAWWALDFPFMRRYSQSFLLKYPHLRGKDIEVTKKACQKFKYIPVSIMNFVEGTRFTPEKHSKQESPYKNLLKPKSGGIGFVFSTMGNMITSILDVTIVYPQGRMSFWDFLCGRVNIIKVHVEEIPVTDDFVGDYVDDPVFKNKFQQWLNDLWYEKDIRINMMKGTSLQLSVKSYAEDEAMIIN
ncbi:MAG: acyltransferase [Spirochaetota bacterium]